MYKAILFDLDGTILEPSIDFRALRDRLSIPQGESILDWIFAQPQDQREAMDLVLVQVETEAARRAQLMPGAEETLAWLHTMDVRTGILTRNCWKAWELARDCCGLDRITDVFTRESGPAKPDPACLTPVTERWDGLPVHQIIHVGDYLYDLELAATAGMYSILLHSSGGNPFPIPCDHVAPDHKRLRDHLRFLLAEKNHHE